MNKIWLYILLLFTSPLLVKAITNKDLVRYDELTFNSPLEKKVLDDYFIHQKKDYIGLFLAIDSTINEESLEKIRQKYIERLNLLNNKKFEKSSEKKKIKMLHDFIHENYLEKYELICLFNELFEDGDFNCVTASALFSIYMNDLNIPFIIKENQIHVYLISYPSSGAIEIETTDPQNRIFNYDHRTKSSFVNHLLSRNIISKEELIEKSIDEIFIDYFYRDEKITIDELIGIQYMNHAAYLMDEDKPKEALIQLEKAYMFYPCEKHHFILLTALASAINIIDYKNPQDLQYLYKLPKYNGDIISDDHIVAEFERATYNILIEENDDEMYKMLYYRLLDHTPSIDLKDKISFIYHFQMSNFYLSQNSLIESMQHIDTAIFVNPDDINALSLFIASVTLNIRNKSSDEILSTLQHYLEKYPFLIDNHLYHALVLESYLYKAYDLVSKDLIPESKEYLDKFQKSFDLINNLPVSKELITQTYASIAVYYFRRSRYDDSRYFLKKGLEYVPESVELKNRLMSF